MRTNLNNWLVMSVFLLGLTAGAANGDYWLQDEGPDGIVSVEAEHFDDNVPQGAHQWVQVGPTGGFTGTAGMQAQPNSGRAMDTSYVTNSPRLDFEVFFAKTGMHYVWVLAWGYSGGDDSCHAGLDGEETPLSNRISSWNNNYKWSNSRYERPEPAQIDVTTPGLHVLNIWMREDGLILDKIVLTTSSSYTPFMDGPMESPRGLPLKAYAPDPPDSATYEETWVSLYWTAGASAVSHDVYFGDNFLDVDSGTGDTLQGLVTTASFLVGFPGHPYPDGLVPGTSYYWRIDEVEADGTIHKGDVWSFTIPPEIAYDPHPPDRAEFIDPNVILSWTAGLNATIHYVYFGDNFADVNDGTGDTSKGWQAVTTYAPGPLELVKIYYWRVDEFDGDSTHKGDVWSFTIAGPVAPEYYVATDGNDSNPGTLAQPLKTIGRACDAIGYGGQPLPVEGVTIWIHGGTYREWVKPVRGGAGESQRISYRAAPGEEVIIKGSERITSWTHEAGGVWKVELPNSFFGEYNPYALKVSGDYLNYGKWHRRGDVYLNGEAFYEKQTEQEVTEAKDSWSCQVDEEVTTIWANFGKANPNTELAEINVRESLFMPEITGLKYITVDGFHFMHAAANWAPPSLDLQMGAVGPRMGKHWIIENCMITNARCVGIILGQVPGVDYSDINVYGDHIIRNNVIQRCGQAGIAGKKGATRSLISGNLIEDTNYRREFGGWETAGIKFHGSVDTVISGNLIRGVYRQAQSAYGIWIDFGNQGIRITGNVIYHTETDTVFLEMNHGPILVDNNVLIGKPIRSNSEATVFAHNLFVDCGYEYNPDTKRRSQYYKPHTTEVAGYKSGTAQDDKWFNNIFVRRGLDQAKTAPGYASDYNVFLEEAKKSSFGDEHSIVDPFVTNFNREDHPLGMTINFAVNGAPFRLKGPWVDAELVGVFPTVGQTIEDRYGSPIKVDTDFNGKKYAQPIAGPLADLKQGPNTIVWPIEKASVEGFERGDFSRLPWEHSGDENWAVTSRQKHSGAYSAKAGAIEDDGNTTLQVTLDCVSGNITFYRKVSSETGCDYLQFYIDGAEKGRWSGEEDWVEVSFGVTAGTRTFEWTYSKDGSESDGNDTAWIDDIVFPVE